jgi:hypothetical protein
MKMKISPNIDTNLNLATQLDMNMDMGMDMNMDIDMVMGMVTDMDADIGKSLLNISMASYFFKDLNVRYQISDIGIGLIQYPT